MKLTQFVFITIVQTLNLLLQKHLGNVSNNRVHAGGADGSTTLKADTQPSFLSNCIHVIF